MAGYKETPRQKMIGMMYLVLTALLALNVSKQIMDAFLVVNESLETTNENFSRKMEGTYSKFFSQFKMNEEKVGPFYKRAEQARALSEELLRYIDSIKYVVIMKTERLENLDSAKIKPLSEIQKIDNFDTPTAYMHGSKSDGSGGEGMVLRNKIKEYKEKMLLLVNEKSRASIKMGIDTEAEYKNRDDEPIQWQTYNFYHTILAATVTILNEIKAEVKNIEFDVVNSIFSEVNAEDYKFDVIRAKVIPESRFVFSGETYNAEIIVAAYETKGKPVVKWAPGVDSLTPGMFAGARSIDGEAGVVKLSIPSGGEGPQRFAGLIQVLDPNGQPKNYHFKDNYVVARRSVSISPQAMLVFYRGLDNPLKVGIPGGGSDVKVDITQGTVVKTDSNYVVRIPAGMNPWATVTVSAVYDDKRIILGSERFKVKMVPPPNILLNEQTEMSISKEQLKSRAILFAKTPSGFDMNARYSVTSFTFETIGAEGNSITVKGTGREFNREMQELVARARRNQPIIITDIKVDCPDGPRLLTDRLIYTIK